MSSSSDESDEAIGHHSHVRATAPSANFKMNVDPETDSSSSEEEEAPNIMKTVFKAPPNSSSESESESGNGQRKNQALEHFSDSSENEHEEKGITPKSIHNANPSNDSSSSSSDEGEEQQVKVPQGSVGFGFQTITPKHEPNYTSDSESDSDDDRVVATSVSRSKPSDDSSGSEDEVAHSNQPAKPQATSDASSYEETVEFKHIPQQVNRPYHTMSSSDSESSDEDVSAALNSKPHSMAGVQTYPNTSVNRDESSSDDESHQNQYGGRAQSTAPAGEQLRDSSSDESDNDQQQFKQERVSSDVSRDMSLCSPSDSQSKSLASVKSEAIREGNPESSLISAFLKNHSVDESQSKRFSGKKGEDLLNEVFKSSVPKDPTESLLSFEDISSDHEIWLIQCPKSMDVKSLKKQQLILGGDTDIQIADGPSFKRFSISSEQSNKSALNCILPSTNSRKFQIKSLPVRGKIIIQEHVHVPKVRRLDVNPAGLVPFPSGLRVRHPLLGVGFEEHIASVKSALAESQKSYKEKKKKRKYSELQQNDDFSSSRVNLKWKYEGSENAGNDEVDSSLSHDVYPHKKKQRLNSFNNQQLESNGVVNNSGKNKKDKHKGSSLNLSSNISQVSESLVKDSNERTSLSPEFKFHSHVGNSSITPSAVTETPSKKQKKSKVKKENTSLSESQNDLSFNLDNSMVSPINKHSNLESGFGAINPSEKSSQKKRKRSEISDSDTSVNSQYPKSFELSSPTDAALKKTHKKPKWSLNESLPGQLGDRDPNFSVLNESMSKKHKKIKIKQEVLDTSMDVPIHSIPSWHTPHPDELVCSVQDESESVGSSKKHKKKKKQRDSEPQLLTPSKIKLENSLNGSYLGSESDLSISKKKSKKKHKERVD